MPDLTVHENIANNNQALIEHLLDQPESHFRVFAPWVVTVAFYRALHLVEYILYVDGCLHLKMPFHSQNHHERNNMLRNVKYTKLWKHYSVLYNASMVTRYLSDYVSDDVNQYLREYLGSVETIRSKMLNHHLRQIEHLFEERKKQWTDHLRKSSAKIE